MRETNARSEYHRNMERRKNFFVRSWTKKKRKKSVMCIEIWITSNSIFKPKTFNTITSFCRPTHSIIWFLVPSFSRFFFIRNDLLSLVGFFLAFFSLTFVRENWFARSSQMEMMHLRLNNKSTFIFSTVLNFFFFFSPFDLLFILYDWWFPIDTI